MSTRQRYADERIDINPKSWLAKYRRTSIGYLFKMLLFYHSIGFLLMLAGTYIVDQLLSAHETPKIPRSLVPVLAAGPIEESIFFGIPFYIFGIPFYIFGNPFFVLVTGMVWAALHILNTGALGISDLAFGNLLFVIPSRFFSLRTWISGKGWFAIITHSSWNGIFYALGFITGEFACSTVASGDIQTELLNSVILSAALLGFTYLLHKKCPFLMTSKKRFSNY